MYHEIERKFLVADMPSLKGIRKIPQERYFIQRSELFEEEMKRKGLFFSYESKFTISKKEKVREKVFVSKAEFEKLKVQGTQVIRRDSYTLTKKSPIISIKKYSGTYAGLVLAEVLFDSVEEMERFTPLDWMGTEVTDTSIGKDSRLIDLSREKFKKIVTDILDASSLTNDTGNFL